MDHSNNSQQSYFSSQSQTPPAPAPDDNELFLPAVEYFEPIGKEDLDDAIFYDIIDDNNNNNNITYFGKHPQDDELEEFLEPATNKARLCTTLEDVVVAPPYRSPQHSVATVTTDGDSTIATENHDTESLKSENTNNSVSDDLAKELYELSMHERQRMMHEVHCVPDEIDDSPETENRVLKELNDWIVQHYDTEEAAAYRTAESISKKFVESRDLRLKYLRAVMDYDIEKAGARYLNHLTVKLELFGESKLCQDRITLADLDEDDLDALSKGFFQILPIRDSGERGIVFGNFNNLEYKTLTSSMRSIYYLLMTLYEQVDFQKKGIVFVGTGLQFGNNTKYLGYQFLYNLANVVYSTPSRPAALHHCLPPGLSGTLVSWFRTVLPPRARIRTRIHVGSHEENMHKLMCHGIPTRSIPALNDDDTQKTDTQWHLEWMEMRKKIDAQYLKQQRQENGRNNPSENTNNNSKEDTATSTPDNNNTSSSNNNNNNTNVIVPSPKDILMGRGKRTMTAPGNIRLYMVLDDNFDRYDACPRHLKANIAKEMVDLMKAQGCRFLEQIDGYWSEVNDVKARNKVSHDFRTLRSSKKGTGAAPNSNKTTKRSTTTKRSRQQ